MLYLDGYFEFEFFLNIFGDSIVKMVIWQKWYLTVERNFFGDGILSIIGWDITSVSALSQVEGWKFGKIPESYLTTGLSDALRVLLSYVYLGYAVFLLKLGVCPVPWLARASAEGGTLGL